MIFLRVRVCFHLCFYMRAESTNETEITSTEQQRHGKEKSQNCLTALLFLLNISEMKWERKQKYLRSMLRKIPQESHMCLLWSFRRNLNSLPVSNVHQKSNRGISIWTQDDLRCYTQIAQCWYCVSAAITEFVSLRRNRIFFQSSSAAGHIITHWQGMHVK